MVTNRILVLGFLAAALLCVEVCTAQTEDPPPKLGFYLVDWVAEELGALQDRPDAYSKFIVHNVDQEFILENSKIRGAPFLTDKDIEKYCWTEQRLFLTPQAEWRWNETGGAVSRCWESRFWSSWTALRATGQCSGIPRRPFGLAFLSSGPWWPGAKS